MGARCIVALGRGEGGGRSPARGKEIRLIGHTRRDGGREEIRWEREEIRVEIQRKRDEGRGKERR